MSTANPQRRDANCPECNAPLVPGAAKCWLCGLNTQSAGSEPAKTTPEATLQPTIVAEPVESPQPAGPAGDKPTAVNPYASPAPASDNLNRTFSLSTMFLWTTLVAVVAGMGRFAPGLGIAMAIFCFPAALRTIGAVNRRIRRAGTTMSVPEKIETFAASVGIVFGIVMGSLIAFTAVCFPLGAISFNAGRGDGDFILVAIVAGIAAGGAAAYLLIRGLWRVGE